MAEWGWLEIHLVSCSLLKAQTINGRISVIWSGIAGGLTLANVFRHRLPLRDGWVQAKSYCRWWIGGYRGRPAILVLVYIPCTRVPVFGPDASGTGEVGGGVCPISRTTAKRVRRLQSLASQQTHTKTFGLPLHSPHLLTRSLPPCYSGIRSNGMHEFKDRREGVRK